MYDGTGNTRKLVDSGGGGPAAYTGVYPACPEPRRRERSRRGRYQYGWQNVQNPFRYGGAWGDITDTPGSGLLQLGQRFYWPEIGRFIQQDPVGDGMNWYAYVGNNPVVFSDPTGEYSLGELWSDVKDVAHAIADALGAALDAVNPFGAAKGAAQCGPGMGKAAQAVNCTHIAEQMEEIIDAYTTTGGSRAEALQDPRYQRLQALYNQRCRTAQQAESIVPRN